jgi:hypothetical protein
MAMVEYTGAKMTCQQQGLGTWQIFNPCLGGTNAQISRPNNIEVTLSKGFVLER